MDVFRILYGRSVAVVSGSMLRRSGAVRTSGMRHDGRAGRRRDARPLAVPDATPPPLFVEIWIDLSVRCRACRTVPQCMLLTLTYGCSAGTSVDSLVNHISEPAPSSGEMLEHVAIPKQMPRTGRNGDRSDDARRTPYAKSTDRM